jgi:uncharacterized protein
MSRCRTALSVLLILVSQASLAQMNAVRGQPSPTPDKTLVLIIDDIGHQLRWGQAAVDLPGKLNIAVLPHTAHGRRLAERAHQSGKEVLLHTPMSSINGQSAGPGTLTAQHSREKFSSTLAENLAQIPHVRGINNHMGSDLTRRAQHMAWLMEELSQRSLYFVDSRTNHETLAAATAERFGVPHLSRQVFLDNERSTQAIAQRFAQALDLVREKGSAVAIGHPYPETIEFLREVLPQLGEQGVRLAYVSELASCGAEDQRRTSIPLSAI